MNERARRHQPPATYQDLLDAPPHLVAELVDGRLHLHPRPALPQAFAGSALGAELFGPFRKGKGRPGGWWIIDAPELHLGNDVLVPDLAGWRRQRMPDFPVAPWTDLAPDWVCEIPSPGTRGFDLADKRRLYAANGIGHLWLVDPGSRTLEAFELRSGQWVLLTTLRNEDEVCVAPFEAVSFLLSELWPE